MATLKTRPTLRARTKWAGVLATASLAILLTGCGSSSSSTATTASTAEAPTTAAASASSSAKIYIDEIPGRDNGADAPLKDQFWWASTKTDMTPVTSYAVNLAVGGTLTVVSEADDPMKVTITGPNGFSQAPVVDSGPDTTTTFTLPTAGDYQIISDPTTAPTRPGSRGGVVHVG